MSDNEPKITSLPAPTTGREAFDSLKDIRADLKKLMISAPMDAQQQTALALLMSAEILGTTAFLMVASHPALKGKPLSAIIGEVSQLIISQMQSDEARGQGRIV